MKVTYRHTPPETYKTVRNGYKHWTKLEIKLPEIEFYSTHEINPFGIDPCSAVEFDVTDSCVREDVYRLVLQRYKIQ